MSQRDEFPAATTPARDRRGRDGTTTRTARRWPQGPLPTGLPTLLAGIFGFIALLYFQHRIASPLVMAACAAFVGAGLALYAGVGRRQHSLWQAVVAGGLAGAGLIMFHTAVTNPGACAVAWMGVLIFGVPLVGGAGAAGSAALVALLRRRNAALPARGGDRVMLAALLMAVVLCGVAVFPFAHNALAYSRLATGAVFAVQQVPGSQGAGSVVAGDRVLVLKPQLGESVSVDVMGLDGTPAGQITWTIPAGAGGVRLQVDGFDGMPYASWVEPVPQAAPGMQAGSEQVWSAVIARLDSDSGEIAQVWIFPAETAWGRPALVHSGYAVLAGESQIACYALAGQETPVELWRAEARGTELMRAAAGTLVVASHGTQPACYHLPTGRLFWQVEGETAAAPVYDEDSQLWIVALRDAFMGLKADEGAVWGFPRLSQAADGVSLMAELFAHDGQLLVLERNSGPSWDWPPVNVALTALNAANGQQLWQTRLERDAFRFAGHVQGVTFIGGTHGLLLGVGGGGAPVFRARVGPVSEVVERPDGGLVLLSEGWVIRMGRLRR